ncbi:MAG: hypothetical protein Q9227_003494 [Pyrenula ochraceoflavens]
MANPQSSIVNAYVIRKALIRKHYLSSTIASWIAKSPASILKSHFVPSVDFELDYAEFLDDALLEAFELHQSFERNGRREEGEEVQGTLDREWWILKPGMSDGGNAIRLFSSFEELQAIFEEWELGEDEDGEDDSAQEMESVERPTSSAGIVTSHLRHFLAQPYIHPPLLLAEPPFSSRKFHIRTYVLVLGALKVYVYTDMLALFAAEPYVAPSFGSSKLPAHLTNTCFQSPATKSKSIFAFQDLPSSVPSASLSEEWKDNVSQQIYDIVAELFVKAAVAQRTNFQPLPNAFELFGVDFLVDGNGTAWLLEVNAFPDFGQTGDELGERIIGGLMWKLVKVLRKEFKLGSSSEAANAEHLAEQHQPGVLKLVGETDLKL